jgi:predicted protein tyrosine phosphatase
MKIQIMTRIEAENFIPDNSTYAIRINPPNKPQNPLVSSPNYTRITEYNFDDAYPLNYPLRHFVTCFRNSRKKLFDEEIARKILEDFSAYKSQCETLLVHCRHASGRSPAIAMALNKIFDLGESQTKIIFGFPFLNIYIYHQMLKTAKKMKII